MSETIIEVIEIIGVLTGILGGISSILLASKQPKIDIKKQITARTIFEDCYKNRIRLAHYNFQKMLDCEVTYLEFKHIMEGRNTYYLIKNLKYTKRNLDFNKDQNRYVMKNIKWKITSSLILYLVTVLPTMYLLLGLTEIFNKYGPILFSLIILCLMPLLLFFSYASSKRLNRTSLSYRVHKKENVMTI